MKALMEIDVVNNEFTAVIPCDCHYCGGVVVEGLDIDYQGPEEGARYPRAYLHVSMWQRMGWEVMPTFWERVKQAFKLVFGSTSNLFIDDMVFFKPKVTELRNVLDIALAHWPSDEELKKPRPTLTELYAKICEKEGK